MQAIVLKDCDVYSYQSDLDTDPFGMHHMLRITHAIVKLNMSLLHFQRRLLRPDVHTQRYMLSPALVCEQLLVL